MNIEIGTEGRCAEMRITPLSGDHRGLCTFDMLGLDSTNTRTNICMNITGEQAQQIRDALDAFIAGLWTASSDDPRAPSARMNGNCGCLVFCEARKVGIPDLPMSSVMPSEWPEAAPSGEQRQEGQR